MAKIIECKKCGGLIDLTFQDARKIECRWCGKTFDRKEAKIVKKIKMPERALKILEQYFSPAEMREIFPRRV